MQVDNIGTTDWSSEIRRLVRLGTLPKEALKRCKTPEADADLTDEEREKVDWSAEQKRKIRQGLIKVK